MDIVGFNVIDLVVWKNKILRGFTIYGHCDHRGYVT